MHAALDLTNVFKQNDSGPLETVTEGYTMMDLQFTYRIAQQEQSYLEVFIKGTNLFDQDARRHTSFLKDRAPLPGQSGILGVRAQY